MTPDELLVCAKTVFGEARGESAAGQRAVAHVIRNRRAAQPKYGVGWAGVCLRPWQFSCWNENDPNLAKLQKADVERSAELRACLISFLEALDEEDFTHGSLHYHTVGVSPRWAMGKSPILQLSVHLFYNNVDK